MHDHPSSCQIIQDENDNSPIFSRANYEVLITENLPLGSVIGNISATDADTGTNGEIAYYGSMQNLLRVDNRTGDLILIVSSDFETLPMLLVTVSMDMPI